MHEPRPAPDAAAFKTAMREQWDRDGKGWSDQTPYIRAWLAESTKDMIDGARIEPGARVLDVAAGAGDQTFDLARRVGPSGAVTATDISERILAFARERTERDGLDNVEFHVADGESLGLPDTSYDAVVCRLGLMFCLDPLQALREMRRVLRPGGRASVLVFSEPANNPCFTTAMMTLSRHAGVALGDPERPGTLMSLGRPGRLGELLARAGFRDVETTRLPAPFRMPTTRHYIEFLRTAAPPAIQLVAALSDEARAAAWDDLESRLRVYEGAHGWIGPNELLLGVGER